MRTRNNDLKWGEPEAFQRIDPAEAAKDGGEIYTLRLVRIPGFNRWFAQIPYRLKPFQRVIRRWYVSMWEEVMADACRA